MKARLLRRSVLTASLVTGLVGFILGPATPAGAQLVNEFCVIDGVVSAVPPSGECPPENIPVTVTGTTGSTSITTTNGTPLSGALGAVIIYYTDPPADPPVDPPADPPVDPPLDPIVQLLESPELTIQEIEEIEEIDEIFNHWPFPWYNGLGTLSVEKAGTGTGAVASTDGLISCGPDCDQSYGAHYQVTLVPTPGPNSSFAGWNISGPATNLVGCGGTGPCTLLLNNWDAFYGNGFNWHTLVTATFNAISTVSPATVTRVTHLHQHGGLVTGPYHHGVRHLKKHAHIHSHVAI